MTVVFRPISVTAGIASAAHRWKITAYLCSRWRQPRRPMAVVKLSSPRLIFLWMRMTAVQCFKSPRRRWISSTWAYDNALATSDVVQIGCCKNRIVVGSKLAVCWWSDGQWWTDCVEARKPSTIGVLERNYACVKHSAALRLGGSPAVVGAEPGVEHSWVGGWLRGWELYSPPTIEKMDIVYSLIATHSDRFPW